MKILLITCLALWIFNKLFKLTQLIFGFKKNKKTDTHFPSFETKEGTFRDGDILIIYEDERAQRND